MKKTFALIVILISIGISGYSQNVLVNNPSSKAESSLTPTLGIVIYSNDAETVWNALRLANFSKSKGETVAVFLLGKGVEALSIENKDFDITGQADTFIAKGGKILACGTCLRMRKSEGSKACAISNLNDLYEIIKTSKKVLTF
jgi:uncharacterized protein involved in oxidation of intracellular sulfur